MFEQVISKEDVVNGHSIITSMCLYKIHVTFDTIHDKCVKIFRSKSIER